MGEPCCSCSHNSTSKLVIMNGIGRILQPANVPVAAVVVPWIEVELKDTHIPLLSPLLDGGTTSLLEGKSMT